MGPRRRRAAHDPAPADDVPVRKPDDDDELLRILASAANEAVDALDLPPAKVAAALNEVVARYASTLRLTPRILHDAMRDAKTRCSSDGAATSATAPTGTRIRRRRARCADAAADPPVVAAADAETRAVEGEQRRVSAARDGRRGGAERGE